DEVDDGARFQGVASLSLPVGCLFGIQFDVGGGDLDGDEFFGAGGHVFMRDPSSYLLGVQAQYIDLNGDDIFRVGPEAELYLGDITLNAMAGFESAEDFGTDDIVAQVEAAYYISDDFKLYGGYRRFIDIDAGAFGFEYQTHAIPAAVFVDGMVGSDDYVSILGGLRFYFGGDDKSLKARQREDDPGDYFNLLTRKGEEDEDDVCVRSEDDSTCCGGPNQPKCTPGN
ncbi:MAG: hypothetical protein ACREVW_13655, partial [Burkholderiales bacterium]